MTTTTSLAELDTARPTGTPALGDPLVRARLVALVRARPAADPVHPAVWQQVGYALAATSRGVDAARAGGAPGSTALLVMVAQHEVAVARVPLGPARRRQGIRGVPEQQVRAARPAGEVERSWSRLAALLGPEPVAPQRLATALREHAAALSGWQQVLRRVVREAEAAVPGPRR